MASDQAIHDLLLPGLWVVAGNYKKDAMLHVDKYGVSVTVGSKNIPLISRDEIEDGSYKRKYSPRLHEIMEQGEWHYER